jgi:hypothetical protein
MNRKKLIIINVFIKLLDSSNKANYISTKRKQYKNTVNTIII